MIVLMPTLRIQPKIFCLENCNSNPAGSASSGNSYSNNKFPCNSKSGRNPNKFNCYEHPSSFPPLKFTTTNHPSTIKNSSYFAFPLDSPSPFSLVFSLSYNFVPNQFAGPPLAPSAGQLYRHLPLPPHLQIVRFPAVIHSSLHFHRSVLVRGLLERPHRHHLGGRSVETETGRGSQREHHVFPRGIGC